MKRIIVTIPTYWSWSSGRPGLPEDSVFDHPTPLDGEGTLGRCLDSLREIRSPDFEVLLITAPVNERLAAGVEEKVESIIAPFKKSYPIAQFGPAELVMLRRILKKRGIDPALVSLSSYAQIRNCQLLGAVSLGCDLIAAVDDDEIVPEDYLAKATEFVGSHQGGKSIDGVGGIYLNVEGDYRIKEGLGIRAEANLFKRKAALMNDEFGSYMERPERLVETSLVLGGNMVFGGKLFREVPFDPGITRGEDIDYLINSRMLGFNWFLDKRLTITHLPPPPSEKDPLNTSPYSKLQQDVIRFVYQRSKIKLSEKIPGVCALSAGQLGLYPGEFLTEGLEDHALEALRDMRPAEAPLEFFPAPEELMRIAFERAGQAGRFFEFKERWKQIVAAVEEEESLRDHLRRKMGAA